MTLLSLMFLVNTTTCNLHITQCARDYVTLMKGSALRRSLSIDIATLSIIQRFIFN